MSEVVASYAVGAFVEPQNGESPIDADAVRLNDNTVRTGFNSHDAEPGIHFQGSTLAARPAAGTSGRKWFASDTKQIFRDNGSSWDEIDYLNKTNGGTVAGNTTFTGTVTSTSGSRSFGATTFTGTISGTSASFSSTLSSAGATFSGAVSGTSATFSSTVSSTGFTATGASSFTSGTFSTTLGVTGAATFSSTIGVAGVATFSGAGSSHGVIIGPVTSFPTYGVLTFSGASGVTTMCGLYGGGDVSLHYNVPTGARHIFEINGSAVGSIDAGKLLWGHSVTINTSDGDVVLKRGGAIRSVNVSSGNTYNGLSLDSSEVWQVGDSAAQALVAMPRVTGIAAGASLKGVLYMDTAVAGQIVFFDGATGARYKLTGTAF